MPIDSCKLKTFASGAQRSKDADGARFELIPFAFVDDVGAVLATGAAKYGEYNWQKGMPIAECVNHAMQHLFKFASGDTSEDHIAHAACNLAFICHYRRHSPDLVAEWDILLGKQPARRVSSINDPGNV